MSTIFLSALAAGVPAADITNPLEGVTPSIDVFGVTFSGAISLLLGGLWAAALLFTAGAVLVGLMQWAWAKRVSHNQDAITAGAGAFKQALIVFLITCLVSVVLGAIIVFAQKAGA